MGETLLYCSMFVWYLCRLYASFNLIHSSGLILEGWYGSNLYTISILLLDLTGKGFIIPVCTLTRQKCNYPLQFFLYSMLLLNRRILRIGGMILKFIMVKSHILQINLGWGERNYLKKWSLVFWQLSNFKMSFRHQLLTHPARGFQIPLAFVL